MDRKRIIWSESLIKSKCKSCNEITQIVHPICNNCLPLERMIKIAPSSQGPNSGLGLFAYSPKHKDGDILFKKKDWIAPYLGEEINQEIIDKRYIDKNYVFSHDKNKKLYICMPYGIQNSNFKIVDGVLYRGPAVYCNDSYIKDYNVCFTEKPICGIRALRNIKQNEELLVDYGDQYWKGVHYPFELVRESIL